MGSTFDVSVVLNTQEAAVNTVEVELAFPPDKLQIANPSLGRSIVQIWASPPTFSNREGRIYLVGGIPTPGITTSDGIVQSFTFRVIAPGEAKISFGKQTSVLANDGFATDVLKQVAPAFFRLTLPPAQGPAVFSSTHPEQGKWYKNPNPFLFWDASPQSQGFSFAGDHNPNGVPDTVVDTVEAHTTLGPLDSGVWYFHVREKAGDSWSGTSHFILNIDTILPAAFGVKVSPSAHTTVTNPILRFFTADSLSGFDHFEIKIVPLRVGPNDSTFFFEATSPYQIQGVDAGRYETVVRAFDKAGNVHDESVTLAIGGSPFGLINSEGIDFILFFAPWGRVIPILILLLLVGGALVLYSMYRHNWHLQHMVRRELGMRRQVR